MRAIVSMGGMTQTQWRAVRDDQVPEDVERLLLSVPEWFGRPESNAEYITDARTMETWTVRNDAGDVVGVTLISWHFGHSAEVHFTVVDRSEHGTGVGTAMMSAVEADVRTRGAKLLQVKTLGASSPDPNYDRTRRFYEKMGFLPLEETDLWDEATPCLIMVMPLV